jgi:hypothetical protein
METKYTFWNLLNENLIEIPIIQRDYAQGRETVEEIRNKLLDVLYKAISSESNSIELDFVYGRIKDGKFIPLDGQQRLTTLFLIHWYLALKEDRLDENTIKILKKFTYETRISSREFCENLATLKFVLPDNDHKLTDAIKNQNWFFESWEKDPTIKSMLTMIDAIHKKFKDSSSLFEKLLSDESPSITFQFLNLEEFNLTDELYIKMNARGKPLTTFENFKANFEKYLQKFDDKIKIDNAWTDLFWKYKDSNNVIDDKFLNFFTNMTLSFYLENNDIEKGKKVDEISIFDIYESVFCKEENTQRIVKLLDVLSEQHSKEIKNIFEVFIGFKDGDKINESDTKLSYWDRVRFYAIAQFLVLKGSINETNNELFHQWKRVSFNLINNTRFESIEHFRKAICSLKKLSEKIDNIYDYLDSDECLIDFFLQEQIKEEKNKASLIKKSEDWKQAILQAEKHWYFDGQIGFILEMAKENNSDCNLEKFNSYFEKLEKIFSNADNGILKNNNFLFHRALLSEGDYLIEKGYNFTFCSNESALRTKIENWRKVFSNDDKRIILKQLLDKLDTNNIGESLNTIINLFDYKADWRYHFVKNPKIIEYCGHLQTRFKLIEGKEDEYEILLLEKSQTNGYHAEYYTYALYLDLRNQGIENIEYTYQKSESLLKSLKYGDKNISWNLQQQKFEYDGNMYDFDSIFNMIK